MAKRIGKKVMFYLYETDMAILKLLVKKQNEDEYRDKNATNSTVMRGLIRDAARREDITKEEALKAAG